MRRLRPLLPGQERPDVLAVDDPIPWQVGPGEAGGPVLGYQDQPLGKTPTYGVPVLYTDDSGFLRGQFGTGKAGQMPGDKQLRSWNPLNDGKWHHIVLSASGNVQTLFVDGTQNEQVTGPPIDNVTLEHAQVGAANPTGNWPRYLPRSGGRAGVRKRAKAH